MASVTQILEMNGVHHNIFDFESLDLFDFDAASNQPISQDFEDLFLQDQPANDAALADSQPTAGPSPDLPSTINPLDLMSSTAERASEPLVEACSENTTNVGGETGCKPRSATSTEREIEAQIQYLRFKLRNGLLSKKYPPKSDDMGEMSSFLEKLEKIESPSETVIRATKVLKVLKKIKKLNELPGDDEFEIKERAARLLEKWSSQEVLSLVINLTTSESESSPPPTRSRNMESRAVGSGHKTESSSSPNTDFNEPASPFPDSNSSPTADTALGTRKRKRSMASDSSTSRTVETPIRRQTRRRTSVKRYVSDEILQQERVSKQIDEMLRENARNLQLVKKRKDEMLEENAQEMELVQKKKTRILEDSAQAEYSVEEEKKRLTRLKEEMLNWDAQREKVTGEWEQSS